MGCRAVRNRAVDRGKGAARKRDSVLFRQDGERVGPILLAVSPLAAIRRPDDDKVDLALGHEKACHVVRDEGDRDAVFQEFPAGESRPWSTGRVSFDVDVDALPSSRAAGRHPGRPVARVASAPALQWVRMLSRRG